LIQENSRIDKIKQDQTGINKKYFLQTHLSVKNRFLDYSEKSAITLKERTEKAYIRTKIPKKVSLLVWPCLTHSSARVLQLTLSKHCEARY